MDTTDIFAGAFKRARERAAREAEAPIEKEAPGSEARDRGRDERGFVIAKAEGANGGKADREPSKQERVAAIEAELDRLARERGTVRSNPQRSRMAKLIGRNFIGS